MRPSLGLRLRLRLGLYVMRPKLRLRLGLYVLRPELRLRLGLYVMRPKLRLCFLRANTTKS